MAGLSRITSVITQSGFNGNLDAIELGNSWILGRGVLDGLAISAGTGLQVAIAEGVLFSGLKAVELAARTHTLLASQTVYVWVNESGTVTTSATYVDPGGTYVCLGTVTTNGSAVTATAATGRMSGLRFSSMNKLKFGEDLLVLNREDNYVGIGVASPAYRFDISTATDDGLARVDRLLLPNIASAPGAGISNTSQVYSRGGSLYGMTPGGTEVLLVDSSGSSFDTRISVLEKAIKMPARVASTGNVTLSSAVENGDSIDGVTLATGDIVLLCRQTTASENGLYAVNASGAPTRIAAFDNETSGGWLVYVMEGVINGGSVFALTTTGTITIGSTSLTFKRISSTRNYGTHPGIPVNAWFDQMVLTNPSAYVDSSSNITFTANRDYWRHFYIPHDLIIGSIGVIVSTGAGGATARVSIYTMDGAGLPDKLLVESGSLDCSSTGHKATSVTQLLPAMQPLAAVFNTNNASAGFRGWNYPALPRIHSAAVTDFGNAPIHAVGRTHGAFASTFVSSGYFDEGVMAMIRMQRSA